MVYEEYFATIEAAADRAEHLKTIGRIVKYIDNLADGTFKLVYCDNYSDWESD